MRLLLVFLTLLPVLAGSAYASEDKRPKLRWQDYTYTFKSKTVNKCVNKAFKALVVNGFEEDADSSVNEKGSYGYAYGWTSDLKMQASIICDLADGETNLIFSYIGADTERTDSIWKKLKAEGW